MEMEPLAYKDNCTRETLRRHVRTMYELYEELFKNRGWTAIAARRTGLNEDTLDLAVRYIIAFHDAGKVFYQDRISRGKGAPLHEAYSVLLFQSYIRNSDSALKRAGENLLMAVEWSILTHHLSMRNPRDMVQLINTLKSHGLSYVPQAASLDSELKGKLEDAIEDVVGRVDLPSMEYYLDDIIDIYKNLSGSLYTYYSVAVRLSKILIVTDNMAASMNRGKQCHDREGRSQFKVYILDVPGPEYDHARGEIQSWLGLF